MDQPAPEWSLPKRERLRRFHERRFAHARLERVLAELRAAVEAPERNSLISVCGPTGVGKTTLLQAFARRIVQECLTELAADPERIPVVLVEAVAPAARGYDFSEFFRRLLVAFDEVAVEHKRPSTGAGQGLAFFGQRTWAETLNGRRDALESVLRRRRPVAVLVDEGGFFTVASAKMLSNTLGMLKSLANVARVPFVLCGTYDLADLSRLDGQLIRRSVRLHFSRYRPDDAEDLAAFADAVDQLGEALPMRDPFCLRPHLELLLEGSLGCVGILKQWMLRALTRGIDKGVSAMSLRHLEATALPLPERRQILSEILEGEARMEAGADEAAFRADLWRAPAPPVPGLPSRGPEVPHPVRPARDGGRRPGRRRPCRDPLAAAPNSGAGEDRAVSVADRLEELTGLRIPPRTRLFRMAPEGLGTHLVEGMPSYVHRLGEAHCLTPHKLMFAVCADRRRADNHPSLTSNWLNDESRLAARLGELTGRDDLASVTMEPWRHLVALPRLRRHCRAWCPGCVRSQAVPYIPLLWSVAAVRACPLHGTRLVEACPGCGARVRSRVASFGPSRCPRCGCGYGEGDAPPAEPWDAFVTGQVGGLIASVRPGWPTNGFKASTGEILDRLVLSHFPSVAAAERHFGFRSNFLHVMLNRPRTTDLGNLCRLAWGLGIELRTLLSEPPGRLTPRLQSSRAETSTGRPRHIFGELRGQLSRLIEQDADGSLTQRAAASRLGVSMATLKLWCPAECIFLRHRRSEGLTSSREARLQLRKERIEAAMREAGRPLSSKAVLNRIGLHGLPHYRDFNALVDQIRIRIFGEDSKTVNRGKA